MQADVAGASDLRGKHFDVDAILQFLLVDLFFDSLLKYASSGAVREVL